MGGPRYELGDHGLAICGWPPPDWAVNLDRVSTQLLDGAADPGQRLDEQGRTVDSGGIPGEQGAQANREGAGAQLPLGIYRSVRREQSSPGRPREGRVGQREVRRRVCHTHVSPVDDAGGVIHEQVANV